MNEYDDGNRPKGELEILFKSNVVKEMKLFSIFASIAYFTAAACLILIALSIMGWSLYQSYLAITDSSLSIYLSLEAVGALIIAIAVLDVAKYLVEEEVFRNKELRSPAEARKTITKLFVITSIATGMEGLVYIFKSGNQDVTLLFYPSLLILISSISIVCLGVYQRLSITVEDIEKRSKVKESTETEREC